MVCFQSLRRNGHAVPPQTTSLSLRIKSIYGLLTNLNTRLGFTVAPHLPQTPCQPRLPIRRPPDQNVFAPARHLLHFRSGRLCQIKQAYYRNIHYSSCTHLSLRICNFSVQSGFHEQCLSYVGLLVMSAVTRKYVM